MSTLPVRRREILILAGAGALLVIIFADIIFFGSGFFYRDVTAYAYPMKFVVREAIRSGEFPYWNPFYSAGEPLAANPAYQLFYPPQWLVLLPDFHRAVQLQILLHFFLGTCGTYVLLRVYGASVAASTFGAFSFGFSGFFLGLANLLWILFGLAWTPWILAFLHLLVTQRRRVYFAAAAVTFGLQVLVGEPMTIVQTSALIAGYMLYRGWTERFSPRFIRMFVAVVGVAVAGTLVAAVQVVPAADFFPDTRRSRGFSFAESGSWSMPPARPVEFIYPSVFGAADTSRGLYWNYRAYPDRARPLLASIYLGFFVVVLAIAGLITRARGSLPLLALVAFFYIVAAGANTGLFRVLHASGIFRALRYPERFFVPVSLAIVVFAAFMMQRLLEGDLKLVRAALAVSVLSAVVAVGSALATTRNDFLPRFRSRWELPDVPAAAAMARLSQQEWWIASGRTVLAAALLLWRLRGRSRAWDAAVWTYVAADLGIFYRDLLPRMPERFFRAPEIVQQLPPDRHRYRIFHVAAQTPRAPEAQRYASLNQGSFWVLRNGLFPYTPALWGFRTVHEVTTDATMLAWSADLTDLLPLSSQRRPHDWADRVSAFSNARFQAYYRPFDAAMRRAGGDLAKLRPVRFVEAPFWQRFYFADRVLEIRNATEFLDSLTADDFTARSAFVFGRGFRPGNGRVAQLREAANRVDLLVETEAPAFLVVANAFHKYWTATIDGNAVPIERTNLAFQGVRVPAGQHRITFRYRNPLVIWGMLLSMLTLIALVVACLIPARNRGAGMSSK